MPSLRMAQASALYGTSGTIGAFPSTCAARPDRTEEADGFHPLRLRHRRRRLRRLRPGQPALGRPGQPGARAGGRSPRLPVGRLHPHAGRADLPDRQPLLRLEVRVRARAAHARPPDLPRPRQGARRLEQHQRDDLPARQPAGLRALGGRPGHADLGLRPLPAVLQADGELPRGRARRPVPRARRPARARAGSGHEPALRGVLPRRRAGRLLPHRRRQRLPAGGLRRLRPQHPARPAAVGGAGLPAPRDEPAQPRRSSPGRSCPGSSSRASGRSAWSTSTAAGPPRRSVPATVILCGGAINSPQLLQLSGVGNAAELERARHRRRAPTCPGSARTSRTTSRSTSSTPASSRSRCRSTSSTGTSR